MAILPSRRRKSGPQRALETLQSALKVYTSLKVAKAGPKAAKAVAKGYAGAKGAKGGAKVARLLVVPALLAALVALVRRARRGGAQEPAPTSDPATSPAPPPVSTATGSPVPGDTAPRMGEAGAPRSATTTASPPREVAPEDAGHADRVAVLGHHRLDPRRRRARLGRRAPRRNGSAA